MTLAVLARSGAVIAVDKPWGQLVIPGRPEGEDAAAPKLSVRETLEAQLGQKVWVVHRLDRDTSGVLLFALDAATHRTLSMAFEAGEVEKKYLAIVQGVVAAPLDLNQPLVEARKRRMRVAREGEVGKASRTKVRPTRPLDGMTLVEAEPLTGRQHQIRVHLAAAGHPLVVDHQYGRKEPLGALTRTPLHCSFIHVPKLRFEAVAQLPEDMAALIAASRVP